MSSFDINKNLLLSKIALRNLHYIYRLFGNYHQYYLQCHLYLMNKLTLSDTTVKCFQIKFTEQCSMKLLQRALKVVPIYQNTTKTEENNWIEFEKQIDQDDVRLFLYLKTIAKFIKEEKEKEMFKLLSPLLVLHVALLIRLSLIDRHLPSNFPTVKFSPMLSKLIVQFQQNLALCLSSYSSSLSWSKIVDIFDGRLFAFTLYQLNQSSSKIYFDSNTIDIVKESLTLLKLSNSEDIFCNIIEQLIQSKHIIYTSTSSEKEPVLVKRQKISRISNPFIDTFLKPILSTNNELTFDFVNPEDSHLSRYEGTRFF
jgi:hypothetical protein